MSENFSLIDFFKQFPDEAAATKFFERTRWKNGIVCPHCGSIHISECKGSMPYRCKTCRKHFSVRVGTVLNNSKLPLLKWLRALYVLGNSKKGISSIKLAEYIGCTQKTSWFLAHRIRELWRFNNKKLRLGSGVVGKIPVFGLKSRSGEVRAFVIEQTDRRTLFLSIRDNVEKGSVVYTDTARPYTYLRGFIHDKVNHGIKEYVRENVYTNGIESFWAIIKRGYKGVYHKWSKKHLARYINEYVSRFNMRNLSALDRIKISVINGINKHLSYKELINGKTI